MDQRKIHYQYSDLVNSLTAVGLKAGDVVFTHVGMGMLGYPDIGNDPSEVAGLILKAFMKVLGKEGTLLVPTYTYSFCNNEIYNPAKSPSKVGYFTEYFRQLPEAERSLDPIFSVAGTGPKIKSVISRLPKDCFGQDCVYDRLIAMNAKICNVGVGFRYATFIHHVEQSVGVPYRYKKIFKGKISAAGKELSESWLYYVRNLEDLKSFPDLRNLEKLAKKRNLVKTAPVGRGEISCINCRDLFDLAARQIEQNPWYLASEAYAGGESIIHSTNQ